MRYRRSGFTLVELLITLTVLAIVVTSITVVMMGSQRSKASTEANIEAQQSGRAVLDIIARDVRSAGFQVDDDATPPQPAFAYVDSVELILYANLQPATQGSSAEPDPTQPPLAPDPGGSPLPAKITGSYVPPMKYATGAEMIRYTFDLNNDGVINSNDQNHVAAGAARRSANPGDYVFARMVYGDSSGTVPTAGNNGGALEKVGLLRGPGDGVPHLFTVYLGSDPSPWNWSSGPVPANRLDEISRVEINVTTESRRPDRNGNFGRSTLTTDVNSLRNVPDAGFTFYTADGYVFNDLNQNGSMDMGEPGISNVAIRMGSVGVDRTNSSGYYFMRIPPGTYTLSQEVPTGYGAFTPDSVSVDFITSPADFTHDFADTARPGGWVIDTSWVESVTENGIREPDEPFLDGVMVSVAGQSKLSDLFGHTQFFVLPGSWSVSAVPPESMVVSTTNPVNIVVNDGDTVHVDFGHIPKGTGEVSGTVYKDINRSYSYDPGEPGMGDVWVGVSVVATGELLGWDITKNNGSYTITVPANMPEATEPYAVSILVPTGHFPTSPTNINPIWVETGMENSDNNFGIDPFRTITLNAERVLSLTHSEFMEKDWTGPDSYSRYLTKGHKDRDLILGSEWSANPNVSVWFNDWNNTPLFTPDPDYQRNAWASALSVDAGPLVDDAPWNRPDLVAGLTTYASGNIAVWMNQNTSGNYGYLPTTPVYYQTLDTGDANVVKLTDLDGDTDLDLIVGTKTATNSGSFEVWLNSEGSFSREASFPPYGGISMLGEVRSLALADFDGDSDLDLVLSTKTEARQGRIVFFERVSLPPFFYFRSEYDLGGEGNAAVVLDVNADGRPDVVVGTKDSDAAGKIQWWSRGDADPFDFKRIRERSAPGIVLSLAATDMGGSVTQKDLAVGYRNSESDYAGGVRIYYLDGGDLPTAGTDPSGGAATFMVPALTAADFDTGDNPAPSGLQLEDLAAAMKSGPTTGAVLVFLR